MEEAEKKAGDVLLKEGEGDEGDDKERLEGDGHHIIATHANQLRAFGLDPLSIHRRKLALLQGTQSLIIEDWQGAKTIALALRLSMYDADSEFIVRDHPGGGKSTIAMPPPHDAIYDEDENEHEPDKPPHENIFEGETSNAQAPWHRHLARRAQTSAPLRRLQRSFPKEGHEFESLLSGYVEYIAGHRSIESITWHDILSLSNMLHIMSHNVPLLRLCLSNVHVLIARLQDEPLPPGSPPLICITHKPCVLDILQDDDQNPKHRGPHRGLAPRVGFRIFDETGGAKIDVRRRLKTALLDKEEAGLCICCGD
ncbi:hypothetical protein I317_01280 [Kwoniella heveanensis CBS 569]|nr:hypothetical protein I317_01280 [Kwoniella heveanensis CBS 569]